MPNTCLHTRYTGESSNQGLPVLDEMRIYLEIAPSSSVQCFCQGTQADYVRVEGDNVNLSLTTEGAEKVKKITSEDTVLSDGFKVYNESATSNLVILYVKNKYSSDLKVKPNYASRHAVTLLTKSFLDLSSDWRSDTSVAVATGYKKYKGTIADLIRMYNLTNLDIEYSEDTDVTYFQYFKGLTSIEMNSYHYGDISILGTLPLLTNLNFRNSKCHGSIEDLVHIYRANGRTTGEIQLSNYTGTDCTVTFNGSATKAKGVLSWTATTITCNGETITA